MSENMVNIFEQVPQALVSRSKFDRSCTYKTSMNADYLYPVFFDEVLPGDTKELDTTFFGRLSTPFVPVLDNIWLDYQLWFVPYRLVWSNFKKFMGEKENPEDSIDYLEPQVVSGDNGFDYNSIYDYFSIRPKVKASVSAKFFRAYNLIWNRRYRAELLQDSVSVPMDDGPDNPDTYTLLKRGKRFDYFTSAVPNPQMSNIGATLPLGNTAPIIGIEPSNNSYHANLVATNMVGKNIGVSTYNISGESYSRFYDVDSSATSSQPGVDTGTSLGLAADLTQATSATINSLRQAIALQHFLEKELYGSRYKEIVFSFFGVIVPDARIQDPEYLGGSSTRINVSPIAQTSASGTGDTPQGNLSAYATVSSTGSGFTKSFTEHGVIIGLASVRTDLTYQQGIDRIFNRKTRYDYYWPTFAHLGMQGILNKEIYATGTDTDDELFGYAYRYDEYRYKNSYITGELRSDYPQSLDIWHLAQKFNNLPVLNEEFIESNTPLVRILAVPGTEQNPTPQLLLDCYHDYTDIRPMPVFAVPGLDRI